MNISEPNERMKSTTIPLRNFFNIDHDARNSPTPRNSLAPLLDVNSKKIHKQKLLFQSNSKVFHQALTQRGSSINPLAVQREDINDMMGKLTRIFEKMTEFRTSFPDDLISYIYSVLKSSKDSFSCEFIEHLSLSQKPSWECYPGPAKDGPKDFDTQWLDFKINKNLETNSRNVTLATQKSFGTLSRIIKLEPKKLENLFFQCSSNITTFNDYLRTKDKKLLWYELEDRVLQEGKEKNPLAYELLAFYKGNEKKLIEREEFLKRHGKK